MFFLKRQFSRFRRASRPRLTFKQGLLQQLSEEYEELYPGEHCGYARARWLTVGLTSIVVVFVMGTGVYAYESPSVTSEHPLHFVKSGIEHMQEGMARSPADRAAFHARMMERRLQEGEHQFPHRPDHVPPSLEEAAYHFEQTLVAIEREVEDEEIRAALIEELSIRYERYQALQMRVEDNAELPPLRERVQDYEFSDEEKTRLFNPMRRPRTGR